VDLLFRIFLLTFVGSVLSLAGGVVLALRKKKFTHSQTLLIASFTAGVILATAFFDLFPEAERAGGLKLPFVLAGIVFLFLFEKSLIWYHHHGHDGEAQESQTPLMMIMGDTVHNAMDGVVIASATIASPVAGFVTALAVGAHEIPSELGEFGVLLSKGWSKWKTIGANLLSSLSAFAGAIGAYLFRAEIAAVIPQVLSFSGGMFTYLACSDLIPELHHGCRENCDNLSNFWQVAVFGFGIWIIYLLISALGV
jgi:zinc and cadmium transporter